MKIDFSMKAEFNEESEANRLLDVLLCPMHGYERRKSESRCFMFANEDCFAVNDAKIIIHRQFTPPHVIAHIEGRASHSIHYWTVIDLIRKAFCATKLQIETYNWESDMFQSVFYEKNELRSRSGGRLQGVRLQGFLSEFERDIIRRHAYR